jgi:hypothetical protein
MKCNYEISPYTGNGGDPPICGARATHGSLCEQHHKWEKREELSRLRSDPVLVAACAVADAWASHGNRPPSITFESPLWTTLTVLELATRNSPLRKVKL